MLVFHSPYVYRNGWLLLLYTQYRYRPPAFRLGLRQHWSNQKKSIKMMLYYRRSRIELSLRYNPVESAFRRPDKIFLARLLLVAVLDRRTQHHTALGQKESFRCLDQLRQEY